MSNSHSGLERFVEAQADDFEQALEELRRGRKRSHWMWYVFPQIAGLGFSAMSQRYAIRDLAEARAYLRHPLLGPRLETCAQALLELPAGPSAHDIFGSPDDLKLRSSMTLFARAAGAGSVYQRVLGRFFEDQPDDRTLAILAEATDRGEDTSR